MISHTIDSNVSQDTQVKLVDLQNMLQSGPIFIGERHSNKFAQNAIKALIRIGAVQKFFIELPNNSDLPDEDVERREECRKEKRYLSDIPRNKDVALEQELKDIFDSYDEFKYGIEEGTGTLLQTALDQGAITIYFHDVPSFGGEIWINGESKKESYGSTLEGAVERNKYSAKLIHENSPGPGTIVLAGMSHLDPTQMGQDNTLQSLLGYANDRVFDLTAREAI